MQSLSKEITCKRKDIIAQWFLWMFLLQYNLFRWKTSFCVSDKWWDSRYMEIAQGWMGRLEGKVGRPWTLYQRVLGPKTQFKYSHTNERVNDTAFSVYFFCGQKSQTSIWVPRRVFIVRCYFTLSSTSTLTAEDRYFMKLKRLILNDDNNNIEVN